MRIIERNPITVYKFEELSDDAKQKAIEDHRYVHVSDSFWMEHIEEELHDLGIEIERLDIDRHYLVLLIKDLGYTAQKVKEMWEEDTHLYKVAEHYQLHCDTDKYAAGDFKSDLAYTYCEMFVKEYTYLTSDEFIAERLEDGVYEFYEDGETY